MMMRRCLIIISIFNMKLCKYQFSIGAKLLPELSEKMEKKKNKTNELARRKRKVFSFPSMIRSIPTSFLLSASFFLSQSIAFSRVFILVFFLFPQIASYLLPFDQKPICIVRCQLMLHSTSSFGYNTNIYSCLSSFFFAYKF